MFSSSTIARIWLNGVLQGNPIEWGISKPTSTYYAVRLTWADGTITRGTARDVIWRLREDEKLIEAHVSGFCISPTTAPEEE